MNEINEQFKVDAVKVWFKGNNNLNKPDIEHENVYADITEYGVYIISYGTGVNIQKEIKIDLFIPNNNIGMVEKRMVI